MTWERQGRFCHVCANSIAPHELGYRFDRVSALPRLRGHTKTLYWLCWTCGKGFDEAVQKVADSTLDGRIAKLL